MNYFLGVDIGTTSSKVVAFSSAGEVLESCVVAYGMQHPYAGRAEQDAEEILAAVVKGINHVLLVFAPHSPILLSFSSAMHSILAVDDAGNVLSPCIIWADNRAAAMAASVRATDPGNELYQATGVPVHAMSPFCKILWWKENNPELLKQSQKLIGIKEYVLYKLVGEYCIDTSVASATGLFNIHTLQWDERALMRLGINASVLSQPVPVTTLFHYSGKHDQLQLRLGTPLVIGASDGALSNLGTGATGPEDMAVTIGTSGAVRMVVQAPETDEHMRTFCYHLQGSRYVAGGANNNGAVVLQWLKEKMLETDIGYEALLQLASHVPAGSNGLVMLPYLMGERAPLYNSRAQGVLFGLNIGHTRSHLVRAAMEGVVYCMYQIGAVLMAKRKVTTIYVSGGFARNETWTQMVADVFQKEVRVADAMEAAALGAVMLGAEAMGLEWKPAEKLLQTFKPNASLAGVYAAGFEKFVRLYEALKGEME